MASFGSLQRSHPPAAGGAAHSMRLQRNCACGNGALAVIGECSACQREKEVVLQTKLAVGARDDPLEREADRMTVRNPGAPQTDNCRGVCPVDYLQLINFVESARVTGSGGTSNDDPRTQNWDTKLWVTNDAQGTWSVDTANSEIGSGHLGSLSP